MLRTVGKYSNLFQYYAARIFRTWRRRQIDDLVSWSNSRNSDLRPGCTALIGMPHHLPNVLLGNLECFASNSWTKLEEIIVVVDSVHGCLPEGFEARASEIARNIPLRFLYYSNEQAERTERIRDPFVFSWLSWSIGIANCRTQVALLHDYDAIILDNCLETRFKKFVKSGAKFQGVRWYSGNGIEEADHLGTTFEAFLDVAWVREHRPVMLFNRVDRIAERTVDFDTFLELQAKFAARHERTIEPMPPNSLVHPSQMICQFTNVRRRPRVAGPVYSLPMIPFFEWLGGAPRAMACAADRISRSQSKIVQFLDDQEVDFSTLTVSSVDWCLKQMLQVCEARKIDPERQLYDYGLQLYHLAGGADAPIWVGDFTADQRKWIAAASALGRSA